ncbi:MAG: amidohydrolase family protein [Verrucomicrobiales bacterium]
MGRALAFTLVGGRDAWMLADRLKSAGTGVILAGTFNRPARRDEAYDIPFTTPAKLHAAGVKFCLALRTDGCNRTTNERNLPYEAALAAAFGLPREDALKVVTLHAADLLGVADELGSIDLGKRATLIVTDGDPLEVTSSVLIALIDGARIDLRNRQTELYHKYRQRLGQ